MRYDRTPLADDRDHDVPGIGTIIAIVIVMAVTVVLCLIT
jgi:hypothetical protein